MIKTIIGPHAKGGKTTRQILPVYMEETLCTWGKIYMYRDGGGGGGTLHMVYLISDLLVL